MIEIARDTPKNIANIEHMLLFCGRLDKRKESEPLFKEQKKFDSMVFTRPYLLFRHKDKFELDPIKVQFMYNIREDYATICTNTDGIDILNLMNPVKKEMPDGTTEPVSKH